MGAKWRDVTRRKYKQTVESVPADTWELEGLDTFTVLVHTWLNTPGWYLTCYELRIERHQLRGTRETIHAEALALVGEKLKMLRDDFNKALGRKVVTKKKENA